MKELVEEYGGVLLSAVFAVIFIALLISSFFGNGYIAQFIMYFLNVAC